MAERGAGSGGGAGRRATPEAELRRVRKRIDALDRRIVRLLDERAGLALEVGRTKRALGRRAVRDDEREKEVLLRVAMARSGPLPAAELLAVYRRLMAAMRRLETADRRAELRRRRLGVADPERQGPAEAPGADA